MRFDKKKYKNLSYEELVLELSESLNLVELYRNKDPDLPKDFEYREAVLSIGYLRNRVRSMKNKGKNVTKVTDEMPNSDV